MSLFDFLADHGLKIVISFNRYRGMQLRMSTGVGPKVLNFTSITATIPGLYNDYTLTSEVSVNGADLESILQSICHNISSKCLFVTNSSGKASSIRQKVELKNFSKSGQDQENEKTLGTIKLINNKIKYIPYDEPS